MIFSLKLSLGKNSSVRAKCNLLGSVNGITDSKRDNFKWRFVVKNYGEFCVIQVLLFKRDTYKILLVLH